MQVRFLLFVASCGAVLWAADTLVVEEIVAKVNGDIVTKTEIERSRKQIEADLRQQKLAGAQYDQAYKSRAENVLRDRIDELLLVQRGKELSINVEAEISKQLADIQKNVKIADPEKFQQFVREQVGMPFEDYKNEMRNGMIRERVIRQEVGAQINVPRAEITKYYEDHKTEFVREERVFLAEIFLSSQGKDEAAVEKKARDLSARARRGEKFDELARDNSESQTAQNGGDLGGWKRGELAKDIEDMVFEQERNFVTDPIKRENGFLILKVLQKHQRGQASFEEVEQDIQNRLFMPRFQPKIREFLTQLRETSFLEIKEGWVDAGAAPGKDTAWKDPAQLKPETVTKEEVVSRPRRKRLLWMVPIPGTQSSSSSASKTATMK
ncbi:MAG: peptidylprolyl isomerase [Bryobacteraceae bacterium]|nr:peptidylprolyl isomerase [Bryobacteraceae bacterium]